MKGEKIAFVIRFTITLFAGLLFYLTNYHPGYEVVYNDIGDIEVEHTTEEKLARITVNDTYTLDGITYYEFTTDVTEGNLYTLTEEEYNTKIGKGNDAVMCKVYTLKTHSDIVVEEHGFGSRADYFEYLKLMDYFNEKNYTEVYATFSNNPIDFLGFKLTLFTDAINPVTLHSSITQTKYGVYEENPFTDAEIQEILEKQDLDNREIIKKY